MKIFWKIYTVVYMLIVITTIAGDFTDATLHLGFVDYFDTILTIPSIIALVGWSWKKAFWSPKFWLAYTVIYFIYDAAYNSLLDNHPSPTHVSLLPVLLIAAVMLPAYAALILYVVNFSAIRFWSKNKPLANAPVSLSGSNQPVVSATAAYNPAPTVTAVTTPWDQTTGATDPQLGEIRHQQTASSALQSTGDSLAQAVRASYDDKIEAEQLGKWPWDRWYNHPVVGRDPEKGIADIIFLSLFGSSSATDKKLGRTQRAIVRIVLTLAVVTALSQFVKYITQ